VVQNQARHASGTDSQKMQEPMEISGVFASSIGSDEIGYYPRQESNNVGISREKPQVPPVGGANSGALSPNLGLVDLDLKRVVDAWPTLPEALRAGILAMIDAAKRPEK
jgi:hypothetical protein